MTYCMVLFLRHSGKVKTVGPEHGSVVPGLGWGLDSKGNCLGGGAVLHPGFAGSYAHLHMC